MQATPHPFSCNRGQKMKKKILLVLVLTVLVVGGVFADSSSDPATTDLDSKTFTIFGRQVDNPFAGAFSFFLKVIIGGVGGALMALRFTFDFMHALIMNGNEGMPGELQKVVIRFVVHFTVALLGSAVILKTMGIFG